MRHIAFIVFFVCSHLTYSHDLDTAQKLVQNRLYDEGLRILKELDHNTSKDPVKLLFYRACCHFSLLDKEQAISDIENLLEYEDMPKRYRYVAQRMLIDIKPLEEDTLDEIGRLMMDTSRRLDLGRTDKKVKDTQQLIIDKLDKLIEKAEREQQQQQQAAQQASQGSQKQSEGSKPMSDSQIREDKGAGDVSRRALEEGSWGNLPPQEKVETIQKISQDLPTHYREAIEAYFRKMATDERK